MRSGADRTDARDLPQPRGLGLDGVEHLVAERRDELLRVDRTDAPDHAGAEVFLDPLDGRRRRRLQEMRLELQAVGAVVDPFPARRDPLAGGDRRGLTDHRHQVALPARLRAEDAEAVLLVVEGHPLDEAGEHLAGNLLGIGLHGQSNIELGGVVCNDAAEDRSTNSCEPAGKSALRGRTAR